MTREEILNMPAGIEMDKAIGDYVLVLTIDPIRCPYCGEEMWMGKYRSRCSNCNEWRYSPYKEYSSGIEEAWEVLEKSTSYVINNVVSQEEDADGVKRHNVKIFIKRWGEASADTAPLAICRAALLAMLE